MCSLIGFRRGEGLERVHRTWEGSGGFGRDLYTLHEKNPSVLRDVAWKGVVVEDVHPHLLPMPCFVRHSFQAT